MSVSVIEELCKVSSTTALVVLESDERKNFAAAIEELGSQDTKKEAIAYASAHGVTNPGINGMPSPYPVDATGNIVENPFTQKIAAYRIEMPVAGR